ncbi:Glutamine synthetase adenylyl-L-tyrosine phosphorylase / Glutamine synthetase adenylyl transferase [Gammaproteobacteria bacterium]
MPTPSMVSPLDLTALPIPLREGVARSFEQYLSATVSRQITPLRDPSLLTELPQVWAASEFISRLCIADPALLVDLADSGDLARPYDAEEYPHRLKAALAGVVNEAALGASLRRLRRREMVRIAWRDLAGRADYRTTVAELSAFADATIDATLTHLETWLHRELGVPHSAAGVPQSLVVLALGKLGAAELNFSSDIDLLFAYPEDGETRGRRSMSNSEFFVRLGQRLIKALSVVTPLGFVFRVDMRLRPFGESGPLAVSFDALETYYQSHGREWERYALIRARPVAGEQNAGQELIKLLHPFVYRRYLDYGTLEALREMKELIAAEVRRKGLIGNVKLGPGGIREVEFIVQGFQLTRGGRTPDLQDPRLLRTLETLGRLRLLPDFAIHELSAAYVFLRDVEHRLQEHADQQTQTLPQDEIGRIRLAVAMGYSAWEAFLSDLNHHLARIHDHFQRVFASPQSEAGPAGESGDLHALWRGLLEPERIPPVLAELKMEPSVAEALARLRTCSAVRALSDRGQERLDRLMPLLLSAAAGAARPTAAVERLVTVLESIGRRTAYVALLVENPLALSQLVRLCAASPWITQQIARFPVLLDDLIDPRSLYALPRHDALADTLRQTLVRLPEDDLEAQMEALRHFRHSNVLRVAAADVTGSQSLMVVSDHLTELAEVILAEVLDLAWHDLVEKHGRPTDLIGSPDGKGFAIIGYGKLGGIELGYGSDLDIVFLHGGNVTAPTDGVHPIETGVFFLRLAQRMIHILTTHTPAGRLYEIDLRLRPSGASGLLVTGLDAYGRYQRTAAWTWEQQALVRARAVAGDPAVGDSFRAIRHEVLCRVRDPLALRREVREMRERMRTELGSKHPTKQFDLKQDRGGIADIEFLVQYAVLRHAHAHPELAHWTDNIRQLDTLRVCGLIPAEDAATLQEAYRRLRHAVHHATLQGESACLPMGQFDNSLDDYRREVVRLWEEWLDEGKGT